MLSYASILMKIRKLKRYDDCDVKFFGPTNSIAKIEKEDSNGKWIKFEDVEELIDGMICHRCGIDLDNENEKHYSHNGCGPFCKECYENQIYWEDEEG